METAPGLGAIEKHLREQILPRYPEIHQLQIYRLPANGELVLWLSSQWPVPMHLMDGLGRIARQADMVAPLYGIQINELGVRPVESFRLIEPTEWDEKPSEVQIKNLVARHDLMAELALLVRTILEISKAGVYTAVQIRHGGKPPGNPALKPEETLGKFVWQVAGWDAHNKIVEIINKAIDEDRTINFCYSAQFRGEDFSRDFQATCKPKPDKSGAWLAVARIE